MKTDSRYADFGNERIECAVDVSWLDRYALARREYQA
jgi:hypothetical protein